MGAAAPTLSSLDDVKRATCQILDDDGGIAGTGFFVLPDGSLLTCHHVIEGLSTLRVAVQGEDEPRHVDYIGTSSNPTADVAVLRAAGNRRRACSSPRREQA